MINYLQTSTKNLSVIHDSSYINLKVKDNKISVEFGVNGVNTRMGESWSYSETNHFQFDKDNINHINKEKSEVKREKFDTGE